MTTSMLVHESCMKLVGSSGLRLEDRRHFFAYAAKTMRNIIIDAARERQAERHGGGAEHVTLGGDDALQGADHNAGDELPRGNGTLLGLETPEAGAAQGGE